MCIAMRDGSGHTMIVCGGHAKRKYCRWCGSYATRLCDFPTGPRGKTCDAPMCGNHATEIAAEVDYCPTHKRMKPAFEQGSLFAGGVE